MCYTCYTCVATISWGRTCSKQADPVATFQLEMEHHMTTNTTAGLRCLAAVAGVVFLSGTAVLIFGDVLKGAPLTEKHYIAAVIIAGTMLVGHLAHEAWRNSKYGSSFAFGFLFAIGTALVVLSSAGRQNETVSTTQAQAEAAEAARANARQGLKRAQAMLAEAQAALGRECKSGSGKRCAGIQRTIDVYEAAARGEQSKLDHIGPAKVVAPDEETFAEVVATIFGASKERVKATAVLAKPFLISLFLEFGAIVSFGFAFRAENKSVHVEPAKAVPTELGHVTDAELKHYFDPDQQPRGGSEPKRQNWVNPMNRSGSGRRFSKDEVLQSLLTQLAMGKQFESQNVMRERFDLPKSTMSVWLNEWQAAGLIPARRQVGRMKSLSAA